MKKKRKKLVKLLSQIVIVAGAAYLLQQYMARKNAKPETDEASVPRPEVEPQPI